MPGWRTTTTTWRKLNCTQHRQTAQASASQRERTHGLPSYLTPNCRLQIRPPTVVSREKLNVAALVKLSNSVADGNICADRMESLCIFSAGFAAFFEAFTKWPILGVARILQQAMLGLEANSPAAHSSPLSRPLLLLPHCPVDGPQAACTFALLKIVRKSCAAPVSDWETMLLQQMRIPLESCIAASTATGLPSLPCFPRSANSCSLANCWLLTYFADWAEWWWW